jgi:hypothetical protein
VGGLQANQSAAFWRQHSNSIQRLHNIELINCHSNWPLKTHSSARSHSVFE